jgi:hypothetical protein
MCCFSAADGDYFDLHRRIDFRLMAARRLMAAPRRRAGRQVMSGAFDGQWGDVTAVLHWSVEAADPDAPHAPLSLCTASLRPALVIPGPPPRPAAPARRASHAAPHTPPHAPA